MEKDRQPFINQLTLSEDDMHLGKFDTEGFAILSDQSIERIAQRVRALRLHPDDIDQIVEKVYKKIEG